jgi:aryl-alcohol dehydrogenase-like predicted oxidoreductase
VKHVRLGSTSMTVSELALGTYTFGRTADPEECKRIVEQYLAAGGNFIDTANVYGRGRAEEIVGRIFARHRDRVVVATKVGLPIRAGDPQPPLSRAGIIRDLEGSLRRLDTDWIDVYHVHWPDERVGQEETFEALSEVAIAGKIRSVGVSNYTGAKLAQAIAICEGAGWPNLCAVQQQYSLLCRDSELDVFPVAAAKGICAFAWSPLGGGALAGTASAASSSARPRSRHSLADGPGEESEHARIIQAVRKIAADVGRTPAQVALNWVRQRPAVTAPILGVRSVEQLKDNLNALEWQLDGDQLELLNRITKPRLPYPHNMYEEIGIRIYD